ncbi:rhomboid family intramembrane serine protease [Parashewanella tropica]|uniref:rhomboid family intramembrane serine protease n=1 Tax=Parashewanella tropica TaxID=2547970 RepID=UPI0010592AC3|nr:rhomboid family intramembrane serine protease [Parashewanella tropica]
MKHSPFPYATLFIAISTFVYSMYVTFDISGSAFSNVKIVQLEKYGAIRLEHLLQLEFWRLFVSQIIHVKSLHMLFNVCSFIVLGFLVERNIGTIKMLMVWLIGGSLGTIFSTLFVKYPWNLGTGGSQAIMAISGLASILIFRRIDSSKWLKFALAFAFIPALSLDLIFSHYPKPGHTLSFIFGLIIGAWMFKSERGIVSKKEPPLRRQG